MVKTKTLDRRVALRDARKMAGLSVKEAAARAYISLFTLYNYEKGKSCPRVDDAIRLAEVYGLSVYDIRF